VRLTLTDRGDLIGLGIWNLNGELLLNSHDDLDGVEGVETEIAGERSGR